MRRPEGKLTILPNGMQSCQAMARILSGTVLCACTGLVSIAQQPFQLPSQQTFAGDNNTLRPTVGNELPGVPGTLQPEASVTVQTYQVPSQLSGTVGAHLQLKYHTTPGVTITTDPNTQQLMVVAPPIIQAEVSEVIGRLLKDNPATASDRGLPAATHQESVYILKNLSWRELEDAISKLVGSKISVTTERNGEVALLKANNQQGVNDVFRVDRRTNQLTILGPRPNVSSWIRVIHSLDQGQADRRATTHVVPLAPAQPRSVQRMIRLVSAQLPSEQDEESEGNSSQQGDRQEAVTALGSVDSLSAAGGLLGDVQIEVVSDIGLIIVKGAKRDVERALAVIDQIKAQAKITEPMIEVLQLQHANSEAIADEVTRLYENIYQPRQGTVSITALVQPNALLIIGRQEIVDSVKLLVAKLDQPLEPQDQMRVIRLKHASAVDLEGRVRDFFVQRPGSDQENRKSLGTRVRVTSDYRTNALIVQASPRELTEVEKLILELDVEGSDTENRVQVFRLRHAMAEDLQRVIQQIVTGQVLTSPTGGGGGGLGAALTGGASAASSGSSAASTPSGRLSIMTVDGAKVESGVLAGVVITADPSVNAIVVKAPAPSMPLLSKLIEELDALPSAEAKVKIYQLRNSDATTVALTLQNLYGLAPTAGQGAQFSLQNSFVNNLARSGLTAGGESSLVQLKITPEARTNSVIVSGGEGDLRVLEAMILRLDEDVSDSRRFEVVWLRNADAETVAQALTSYFQNYFSTQSQLVSSGVISAQEALNRQVLVVPEVATNSLLLSANRELFETAMRLIERMDRRPPMVAIQVLMAEIELNDSFDLGAEWGLQDSLLYSRGTTTAGTLGSPIFNLRAPTAPLPPVGAKNMAGQAMSTFGTGRANSDGVGGLVLSASSESVGVLVRALQTAGRLQVLNRPQLTTLDMQEATATVGGLVPRVTGISQAGVGVPQQIQTSDVSVGLILAVRPRVSPDGLILMNVGVENSSVGDPNAGIPIGFGLGGEVIRSPIINQTRAETVVSAYSGQTVVFAGLISKTRASTRRQIPFLGSLPWVGAAFRFDTETESRKELLVVLTPRIIQTDEDYEMLKQVESARMSWCLADVVNLHGDVGLSGGNGLWGPARSQMLYPDTPQRSLPDRTLHQRGDYYPLPMMQDEQYFDPGQSAPAPLQQQPDAESSRRAQPELKQAVYSLPVQTLPTAGRTGNN
ncbi:MAG: hypothetical protein KF752_20795 [Pirellulaceae bacterium]|nr:hypothetical protein [Pirellulaceae bacterium]